jgi:hypothetical protein
MGRDGHGRESSIDNEQGSERPRKRRKRGRRVAAAEAVMPIPISLVDKMPTLVVA